MACAILGEREALPTLPLHDPFSLALEVAVPPCFSPSWLGSKPHYADQLVTSPEGWMVWTYLPSGDPCWVADCPTYAEANALALALSATTLWDDLPTGVNS